MPKGPEQPKYTPGKIAKIEKIEKSRTLSDAELLKGGAEYGVDEKGKSTLELTERQKEIIRSVDEASIEIADGMGPLTQEEIDRARKIARKLLEEGRDNTYHYGKVESIKVTEIENLRGKKKKTVEIRMEGGRQSGFVWLE